MFESITGWLAHWDIESTALTSLIIALSLIVVIAIITHFILHRGLRRILEKLAGGSQDIWRKALFERQLYRRLALTVQALIIQIQAGWWLESSSVSLVLINGATQLWMLLFGLLTLYSVLDALLDVANHYQATRELPLRGVFQSIKLVATLLVILIAIAILVGRSPWLLLSGLGAMTAVLLLVFKDPLMGLVAGIQLSANRMLKVGDWLDMPRYGADGDVIDINLTTVKVRNWDQTITTVPTYALIADSFKNWRGMQESGGRRIMRSIRIDLTSIHFLSPAEIEHLRRSSLLANYLETRLQDIERYNSARQEDLSCALNGRRLTNLGTFRAYLDAYIKSHSGIHQGMLQLVRQLEPDANGIPLQIYAFTNTTAWVQYEGVQADIFDHILAVIPEFGLRLHQSPTGNDVRGLAKVLSADQ